MITLGRKSGWKFDTSSSAGAALEFVNAEGGWIYLLDPTGKQHSFRYGGAGVGYSWGFKLPKIGKITPKVGGKGVGGAVAPKAFPNAGEVFMLDSFKGKELARSDITGVCLFVELAAGLGAGGSGTAMILGMDPAWLAAMAAGTVFLPAMILAETNLLRSATALLFMAGANVGVQAGFGGAAYLGALF